MEESLWITSQHIPPDIGSIQLCILNGVVYLPLLFGVYPFYPDTFLFEMTL